MKLQRLLTAAAVLAAVTGCEQPSEPTAASTGALLPAASQSGEGLIAGATGSGQFTIADVLDVKFSFRAQQTASDLSAVGHAHHSVVFEGELVEFDQRVTCMAVDPLNSRAWIGGVITQNNSTHPAFNEEIHQPGHDIWFRVVDYDERANGAQPDRSTFVGFEGSADIPTSIEYCRLQIWPDDDARTNPVTQGNIQVSD